MTNEIDKAKEFVFKSNFFKEYCQKKEQVMKYKWIESEKQGRDIGLEKAWLQWEARYYRTWKNSIKQEDVKNPPLSPNEHPNSSLTSTN